MICERVIHKGHTIDLVARATWEVREIGDDTVYWTGRTVGECIDAIDEVLEDVEAAP